MKKLFLLMCVWGASLAGSQSYLLCRDFAVAYADFQADYISRDQVQDFYEDLQDNLSDMGYAVSCSSSLFNLSDQSTKTLTITRCSGKEDDEFDYTESVMGGMEMLAGGLIMITPVPGSTTVGGGMVVDGVRRVFDNISEKAKENRETQRGSR